MVEFLGHRYGIPPWELEDMPIPFSEMERWLAAGLENIQDEGALGIGAGLGKIMGK